MVARLPTVNSLPGGKASPSSENPYNGCRTGLFSEIGSRNTESVESKQMNTHCESKATVKHHKIILPTLTKTGRQHMGTIGCGNGSDANTHYQSLISPRTLINGLTTSINHSKAQKPQVCVSNVIKSQIVVGVEKSKPNETTSCLCPLLLTQSPVPLIWMLAARSPRFPGNIGKILQCYLYRVMILQQTMENKGKTLKNQVGLKENARQKTIQF